MSDEKPVYRAGISYERAVTVNLQMIMDYRDLDKLLKLLKSEEYRACVQQWGVKNWPDLTQKP